MSNNFRYILQRQRHTGTPPDDEEQEIWNELVEPPITAPSLLPPRGRDGFRTSSCLNVTSSVSASLVPTNFKDRQLDGRFSRK